MKRRVAILISGRGSNMAALIDAAAADADFPADIVAVMSNTASAGGLAIAEQAGIPTVVVESKPFGKDRAGFEAKLQAALDDARVELICLGGFMRLFTAEFVQRWHGKILNIHPSLLPSFPGLDPHGQALRAGVKISGATVHFVIPETDAGPIVMQGAVAVRDDDDAESLAARVLSVEHKIYPEALRLVASDAARLDGDYCRLVTLQSCDDSLIVPPPR
ncbi:phosphoribosylglycinamide formyltransferase-1 [Rhodopseudomonas rhenobacensis]|uniref:Phosphoribosylglycinamide formyltransferase n=1 Tax=Rhodopseudomonas rhenobacensis TaxID=87461 RepID=A0A7W8DZ15_9BRAD|nr:phosphoribosylglycinamide formyltransferase-1 [Rhodopseudomonas rhenobacensis]